MKKKIMSIVLSAAVIAGTLSTQMVFAADATACSFTLTADTKTIHPGEEVILTLSVNPNGDTLGFEFDLGDLPAGFTYVDNSFTILESAKDTLKWSDFQIYADDRVGFFVTDDTKVYNGGTIDIATFKIKADDDLKSGNFVVEPTAIIALDTQANEVTTTFEQTELKVPALKLVEENKSTCQKEGNSAYYVCEDNCGRVYKDSERKTLTTVADETLPTIEHSFTSEKVEEKYLVNEANCQHPAVYYKSCSMCGEKGTETFENGNKNAENHTNVVDSAEVKPTETSNGKTAGKVCKDCGEVVEGCEVIPALEHMKDAEYHEAKDANCQEAGNVEYYYCKNCGKYYSDAEGTIEISAEKIIVEKKDHTYVETVDEKYLVSKANCQHPAVYYKSCSMCGEKGTETFESGDKNTDNHTNVVDSAEVKPTETAEGKTAGKVCKDCGEVVEGCEVIPKLVHMSDVTKVEAKAAIATQDGNIEYYICKSCGKYYSDAAGNVEISLEDTVVKATGETKPDDTNPGTGRGPVVAIAGIIALGAIIALKKRK